MEIPEAAFFCGCFFKKTGKIVKKYLANVQLAR